VAINKIDEMDETGIDRVRGSVRELNDTATVVAVSAEERINLEDLMGALR
jgi:G3E family GTPase